MNAHATPQRRHRPTVTMKNISPIHLQTLIITTTCYWLVLLLLPITPSNAFAAWFVDRRISCLTDLAPNEIIMNNGVLEHTSSREPSIHLEVIPLDSENSNGNTAEPNSEYVVKFVVPDSARENLSDIQYVLELVGNGEDDTPAKFTTAPPNGGIGCEGKRSHGRDNGKSGSADSNAAIVTINGNATKGSRLEIVAGWATGHEAVTLTDKIVLIVGEGVVQPGNDENNEEIGIDDALTDDEAEAELEEAFIEEERTDLEEEIELAEEDAVEALEEKRQQTYGSWKEINEAEEEIVEELEMNRQDVDQALDSLKEEIISQQAERQKEKPIKHEHTAAQRRQAQHEHRAAHERRHEVEDRLSELHRRFEKEHDVRKDKLDELMDKKAGLKENIAKLQQIDKKEHDNAKRHHIKSLSKDELKVDMKELKQKAKDKMNEKLLGVHELLNDPHMKQIRSGLRRVSNDGMYHGDVGQPLPPEGKHFLIVMFSLFGLVGLIRWYMEKRRKAIMKGRRSL